MQEYWRQLEDGTWNNQYTGATQRENPFAPKSGGWDYSPYTSLTANKYSQALPEMMFGADSLGVRSQLERIFGAKGKGPQDLLEALQQQRNISDHGFTDDMDWTQYVKDIAGRAGITDVSGLPTTGDWAPGAWEVRKAGQAADRGLGGELSTMGMLGLAGAGMYGAGSFLAGGGLGGLGGTTGLEAGALAGGEAAPAWLSNVPQGSVFGQTGGIPSLGMEGLNSTLGTSMVTTGGASAPWYSGIGANSGLGPLASGTGENMFGASLGGGGGVPSPTGVTAPPPGVGVGKSILDQGKEIAKEIAPYAPLLGAGAGLLSGGTKPAGSITIEEGIPDWLKGYMKPALDKYSTDIQNYQTDPYGIMPGAMQEFKNTISGQYLDPSTNKYLEDYFRLGSERVKGTLSPSFGHMQAFGSNTGYNEALSRGLGDLATGLYGGAYEKERDRQSQAMGAAPSFLTSASQSAFAPYQNYLSTLSGLGKKKEQPYFDSSALSKMLGGALAGASFGNIFK